MNNMVNNYKKIKEGRTKQFINLEKEFSSEKLSIKRAEAITSTMIMLHCYNSENIYIRIMLPKLVIKLLSQDMIDELCTGKYIIDLKPVFSISIGKTESIRYNSNESIIKINIANEAIIEKSSLPLCRNNKLRKTVYKK